MADSFFTWKFTHTQVSPKVENAFQALSLDEPRAAFQPALWERIKNSTTNLKQCWFPGSHANIGGGWYDQQIADITLAWMCDQLSNIGVEFDGKRMEAVFLTNLRYSAAHPYPYVPSSVSHSVLHLLASSAPKVLPWANIDVYIALSPNPVRDADDCPGEREHPHADAPYTDLWATARPWALGQIRAPTSMLQLAMGTTVRRPGLAMRIDPETNEETDEPLLNTAERVHSSVRVRLACAGLGLDDKEVWECLPLREDQHGDPLWALARGTVPGIGDLVGPVVHEMRQMTLEEAESTGTGLYTVREGDGDWRWVFRQPPVADREDGEIVPVLRELPEEPMVGVWERLLLTLTVGKEDVWRYAQANAVVG